MGDSSDIRFVIAFAPPQITTQLGSFGGVYMFRFKLQHPYTKGADAKPHEFKYQCRKTEFAKTTKDGSWKIPILSKGLSGESNAFRIIASIHYIDPDATGKTDLNPPELGHEALSLEAPLLLGFFMGSADLPFSITLANNQVALMEFTLRIVIKVPPIPNFTLPTDFGYRLDLVGLFHYPYSRTKKKVYMSVKAAEAADAESTPMSNSTGDHALWYRPVRGDVSMKAAFLEMLFITESDGQSIFSKFKMSLESKVFSHPCLVHIHLNTTPKTVAVFLLTLNPSPARILGNYTFLPYINKLKIKVTKSSLTLILQDEHIVLKAYLQDNNHPEENNDPFCCCDINQTDEQEMLKIAPKFPNPLHASSQIIDPKLDLWDVEMNYPIAKGKLLSSHLHIYLYALDYKPIVSEGKVFETGFRETRKIAQVIMPFSELISEDVLLDSKPYSAPLQFVDQSCNPGRPTSLEMRLQLISNEEVKRGLGGAQVQRDPTPPAESVPPLLGLGDGMAMGLPGEFPIGMPMDPFSSEFGFVKEIPREPYIEPVPEKIEEPPPPPPAPEPVPEEKPVVKVEEKPKEEKEDEFDELNMRMARRRRRDQGYGMRGNRSHRNEGHSASDMSPMSQRSERPQADYESISFLEDKITNQEILIDDMKASIRGLNKALQESHDEIANLKKKIKEYQSLNTELKDKLHKKEAYFSELAETSYEDVNDPVLVKRKLNQMQVGYLEVVKENDELQREIEEMEGDLKDLDFMKKRFEEMEAAQQKQNKKILELQEDKIKVDKLKDTITTQEKVIQKLEHRLEVVLQDARRAKLLEEELKLRDAGDLRIGRDYGEARGMHESRYLQDRVKQLEVEVESLRQEKAGRDREKINWEQDRISLLQRAEVAEAKCNTLEHQILENTRNFAKRLSQDKIKSTEKEAALNGGFGSLTSYVLDEAPQRKV
eukprot:TRINITY_DN5594_c0_g1_i2.p1 TRINITY_DN5594_c0_g1~~TRINITY_DN5594_c0_g1_i2.p1  ORF type:complete len:939 (+),score=230.23 TRINITY_DN5594_c0_g1_i2:45-2861(+)